MESISDDNNAALNSENAEMYYAGMKYPNITHRPAFLEYIAMDFPVILLCMAGWLIVLLLGDAVTPWTISINIFLLLFILFHCQYITSMKYHIGLEQLMYQRGLFTLKRDYIEMYRIVDYEETRSFLQILFGLKTVTVYACDRTTPQLRIIGIPKDLDIIPTIRERCEYSKKIHGVYEIANRL